MEVLQEGLYLADGTGRVVEVAGGSFGVVVRGLHDVPMPTLVAVGRAVMRGREAKTETQTHTYCDI